ncbi:DUF3274 domain-containing protein [Paraburkholderia sp. Tr-20389]|uniref:T6SS effector phospholipase Tle3 domain-containing protein n=1 Tax=Paraburkholderia sp. Tr-20389 TaxID=2703903 RepID=UPI00197FDEB8|nr:DUF3274 domain-containing protein [Paraburkholderia sp. Tr-20389]MBN3751612.1 DUF3274 domain-containing protein [Paraburkholderia sp. Tr-20389]
MADTKTPNNTLRNSKHGQEAMPMPEGSGAMLTCKVPVKPPMPCAVIVIHGVNDDGQFFPVVDQNICSGLNKRLGRDDLFPHKWESWTPEGKVPSLDTTASSSDCMTRISEEGRSPVIPFHWGYHPVNFQEYHQDQLRYKEQLDARNANPDLPYSTYYLANQAKYANKDSLGNWLDGSQAKEGGPFANATTNLIDMWGPSANGGTYDAIAWAKRQFTDTSSPMYPNPHRIYYVHAAQRLANLILRIRREKNAGPDTINIVAHSQGTEISMLANFLVEEAGERPVDCVIMCNSPYALEPATAELVLPGKHQSRNARVQTLVNFASLIYENRNQESAKQVVSKGVANKHAWSNPDHGRDNFGHVYNYFCPQDGVVSLPNIQGIGWQGVDGEGKQAIAAKAPSFFQRVFSDGHVVGRGPESFAFGSQAESPIAGSFMSRDRSRMIDGPKLPESYAFRTLSNDPDHADHVGEHLAGTTLAQEGPQKLLRLVDTRTGAESVSSIAYPSGMQASTQQVQDQLTAAGYKNQVLKAWFMGIPTSEQNQYLVQRYEKPDEAVARLGKRTATWSQHSAITLHAETIAKCMAYDLAIGLCVAFDDEKLWWDLIRQADWRNPKSPDIDAAAYYTSGKLPFVTKRQMSKPELPKGVISEVVTASGDVVGSVLRAIPGSALVEAWQSATTPPGGAGLWPLPQPDVRG